jgi:hypothetical protein
MTTFLKYRLVGSSLLVWGVVLGCGGKSGDGTLMPASTNADGMEVVGGDGNNGEETISPSNPGDQPGPSQLPTTEPALVDPPDVDPIDDIYDDIYDDEYPDEGQCQQCGGNEQCVDGVVSYELNRWGVCGDPVPEGCEIETYRCVLGCAQNEAASLSLLRLATAVAVDLPDPTLSCEEFRTYLEPCSVETMLFTNDGVGLGADPDCSGGYCYADRGASQDCTIAVCSAPCGDDSNCPYDAYCDYELPGLLSDPAPAADGGAGTLPRGVCVPWETYLLSCPL